MDQRDDPLPPPSPAGRLERPASYDALRQGAGESLLPFTDVGGAAPHPDPLRHSGRGGAFPSPLAGEGGAIGRSEERPASDGLWRRLRARPWLKLSPMNRRRLDNFSSQPAWRLVAAHLSGAVRLLAMR